MAHLRIGKLPQVNVTALT